MECPRCGSTHIRKNGRKYGKLWAHLCDLWSSIYRLLRTLGYSEEIRSECLEMYVNGSGFRAIERVKKIHHTTIINWVKKAGKSLPNSPDYDEIPEITQVDELETFVGKKKTKFGCGQQ
jgi:transposase-like protein